MSDPGRKVGPEVRARGRGRLGSVAMLVAGVLVFAAVVVGLAWYFFLGRGAEVTDQPVLEAVIRGPYEHVAIEQGEIESGNNVEVCCEVRARVSSSSSTSIVDVIPDGSWVQKGDWLITFDSSNLEQEHRKQKIAANSREAIMIKAKAAFDTAVYARQEYLEGTYTEQEKAMENLVFLAEEGLKKAQLSYDSTKRLVSRGLLSTLQLEGEKFRVDAASNDLALAQRKRVALEQFTRAKMLTKLDSDIQSGEVKYRNEQASYQEELHKLRDIEEQISKCRVVAPRRGRWCTPTSWTITVRASSWWRPGPWSESARY